ncbi:MAG: sigma-70 family RNA polymerase sigma factor [Clostridiales bacterium]|nr:sigma-70 family RNA polymerase sigma factor [Clostridiales bacterium]
MDDSQIIELYFDRSEEAITETDKKYGGYCNTIAYNILQNSEDSEECQNDTYLKCWNTIPPTRPLNFKAFIGRIARNIAINIYDKRNAQKRGSGTVELALDELEECIPATDIPSPSEDSVITDCLNAFLRSLPPQPRNVFINRYWYMASTSEIAKKYNMNESTVRVTLKRTREKLKLYMEKEGIIL